MGSIGKAQLTGGVLAGGRSSRFGSNKAMQVFQGKTFLQRDIDLLEVLCAEVMISSSKENAWNYSDLGKAVIPDVYSDSGPLAGIYSMLIHCKTPYMLVLTCDMPAMSEAVLKQMTQHPGKDAVCWQFPNGTLSPFPMLVCKNCLPALKESLDAQQLQIKKFLMLVETLLLEITKDEEIYFSNINTIEDLNKLT